MLVKIIVLALDLLSLILYFYINNTLTNKDEKEMIRHAVAKGLLTSTRGLSAVSQTPTTQPARYFSGWDKQNFPDDLGKRFTTE